MQFAPSQLNSNLHYMVCRTHAQEKARGPVRNDLELWVENMVQLLKSASKYMPAHEPERHMSNSVMLREAHLRYLSSGKGMKTIDQLDPSYRHAPMDSSAHHLYDSRYVVLCWS
jgi:hypothetical protein